MLLVSPPHLNTKSARWRFCAIVSILPLSTSSKCAVEAAWLLPPATFLSTSLFLQTSIPTSRKIEVSNHFRMWEYCVFSCSCNKYIPSTKMHGNMFFGSTREFGTGSWTSRLYTGRKTSCFVKARTVFSRSLTNLFTSKVLGAPFICLIGIINPWEVVVWESKIDDQNQ